MLVQRRQWPLMAPNFPSTDVQPCSGRRAAPGHSGRCSSERLWRPCPPWTEFLSKGNGIRYHRDMWSYTSSSYIAAVTGTKQHFIVALLFSASRNELCMEQLIQQLNQHLQSEAFPIQSAAWGWQVRTVWRRWHRESHMGSGEILLSEVIAFTLKQVSQSNMHAFVITGTALCMGEREESYVVKNYTQNISISVSVYYCSFPPNKLFFQKRNNVYTHTRRSINENIFLAH